MGSGSERPPPPPPPEGPLSLEPCQGTVGSECPVACRWHGAEDLQGPLSAASLVLSKGLAHVCRQTDAMAKLLPSLRAV